MNNSARRRGELLLRAKNILLKLNKFLSYFSIPALFIPGATISGSRCSFHDNVDDDFIIILQKWGTMLQ